MKIQLNDQAEPIKSNAKKHKKKPRHTQKKPNYDPPVVDVSLRCPSPVVTVPLSVTSQCLHHSDWTAADCRVRPSLVDVLVHPMNAVVRYTQMSGIRERGTVFNTVSGNSLFFDKGTTLYICKSALPFG